MLKVIVEGQVGVVCLCFSLVSKEQKEMPPPIRMPTPYGGRLKWKLPGGNNLIIHLKDKNKIRHRKRWSQVGDVTSVDTIYICSPKLLRSIRSACNNFRLLPICHGHVG